MQPFEACTCGVPRETSENQKKEATHKKTSKMQKLKILISLFALMLITGSAFAQPQLKYDDYDDVTIVETKRTCNWFVNSFGFTNHRKGICLQLSLYFPGKWATMQTITHFVVQFVLFMYL